MALEVASHSTVNSHHIPAYVASHSSSTPLPTLSRLLFYYTLSKIDRQQRGILGLSPWQPERLIGVCQGLIQGGGGTPPAQYKLCVLLMRTQRRYFHPHYIPYYILATHQTKILDQPATVCSWSGGAISSSF